MSTEPIEELLCNEWIDFSDNIDASLLQDSFLWRSTTIARELATILINEEGHLDEKGVKRALFILETESFSLHKGRYHDAAFMESLKSLLEKLDRDPRLKNALKRVSKPVSHPLADKIIRATLQLKENFPIKEKHAKQAALAALFCALRQNVGSCFATAPAIRIQREYPAQLLADIAALFGTGRLQRIHEGVEYRVPLSFSFGVGELLKPIFLNALGKDIEATLSTSYSLLLPLERAGVIDSLLSQEEKQVILATLLKKSGLLKRVQNDFVLITVEEILRHLLQVHFKLSEADIKSEDKKEGFALISRIPILRGGHELKKERFHKTYLIVKEAFVAMTDNPLLKSWEFTLASLSESKADFAQWNLSASLGLNPEEAYGIGQILYENIQNKIGLLNSEIEEMQRKYEQIFLQAKYIEGRIQKSATEKEQQWLLADYNVRKLEIDHALRQRDEAYEKGNKLRELFAFMLHFYQEKFKEYFQEIYDPEMHDLLPSLYDDSPAGFRLLYKHGRKNPSLWTYIYTLEEYTEALVSFFTSTENELRHKEESEGLGKELGELVTVAVLAVREQTFLEASFYRLGKAYGEKVVQDPLLHQERVKRKPWAYVSGGTMTTLLSCYYGLSNAPREESCWVESVTELFAFYLDTLKTLPLSIQNYFSAHDKASMLAFSPTHAFLLLPGYSLFKRGWQSDLYSYTWIRDEIVNPAAKFISSIELDQGMMAYLSEKVCAHLPPGYRKMIYRKLLQFNLLMSTQQYKEEVMLLLSYERWFQQGGMIREMGEQIDAILYESLPFTFGYQLEERVVALCEEVSDIERELCERMRPEAKRVQEERGRYELVSARELLELTKSLLQRVLGRNRIYFDLHSALQRAMQKLEFALRAPVLFGDTNWVKNHFGFCVSPGSLELELWRFDIAGSSGRPITAWKEHLDGRSKGKWGLLTNLTEYGEIFTS